MLHGSFRFDELEKQRGVVVTPSYHQPFYRGRGSRGGARGGGFNGNRHRDFQDDGFGHRDRHSFGNGRGRGFNASFEANGYQYDDFQEYGFGHRDHFSFSNGRGRGGFNNGHFPDNNRHFSNGYANRGNRGGLVYRPPAERNRSSFTDFTGEFAPFHNGFNNINHNNNHNTELTPPSPLEATAQEKLNTAEFAKQLEQMQKDDGGCYTDDGDDDDIVIPPMTQKTGLGLVFGEESTGFGSHSAVHLEKEEHPPLPFLPGDDQHVSTLPNNAAINLIKFESVEFGSTLVTAFPPSFVSTTPEVPPSVTPSSDAISTTFPTSVDPSIGPNLTEGIVSPSAVKPAAVARSTVSVILEDFTLDSPALGSHSGFGTPRNSVAPPSQSVAAATSPHTPVSFNNGSSAVLQSAIAEPSPPKVLHQSQYDVTLDSSAPADYFTGSQPAFGLSHCIVPPHPETLPPFVDVVTSVDPWIPETVSSSFSVAPVATKPSVSFTNSHAKSAVGFGSSSPAVPRGTPAGAKGNRFVPQSKVVSQHKNTPFNDRQRHSQMPFPGSRSTGFGTDICSASASSWQRHRGNPRSVNHKTNNSVASSQKQRIFTSRPEKNPGKREDGGFAKLCASNNVAHNTTPVEQTESDKDFDDLFRSGSKIASGNAFGFQSTFPINTKKVSEASVTAESDINAKKSNTGVDAMSSAAVGGRKAAKIASAIAKADFAQYHGPSQFRNLRRRHIYLKPVIEPNARKSRFAIPSAPEAMETKKNNVDDVTDMIEKITINEGELHAENGSVSSTLVNSKEARASNINNNKINGPLVVDELNAHGTGVVAPIQKTSAPQQVNSPSNNNNVAKFGNGYQPARNTARFGGPPAYRRNPRRHGNRKYNNGFSKNFSRSGATGKKNAWVTGVVDDAKRRGIVFDFDKPIDIEKSGLQALHLVFRSPSMDKYYNENRLLYFNVKNYLATHPLQ